MEKKLIIVSGDAEKRFEPDTVDIRLDSNVVCAAYEEAFDGAKSIIQEVSEKVVDLGYDPKSLKTSRFKVDVTYRSVKEGDGGYKKVFNGYRGEVSLSLEVPLSSFRIEYAKTLSLGKRMEIRLGFVLKDVEKAKDEVMALAVARGMEKARIIAETSNTKIKCLYKVDHAYRLPYDEMDELRMFRMPVYNDCMPDGPSSLNINPEDLTLTDRVTMFFEME